ncbi:ATP-grasp domain-containing protein [Nonomuraea antimicrobica]|uniref:ATP-grasp domain-containing protein n=1 Tax=Nonomuraea antimicrobica TaxID=561173 RepID=UPI0031F143A7
MSVEPPWVRAWTGGLPAVHVGNVAEFNAVFGGIPAVCDHYSCLAAFGSPWPALIVLPLPVQQWWIRHLAATLGWGEVRVRGGLAAEGQGAAALAGLPEIVSPEVAVLPWGRTPAFDRIRPAPAGVLDCIRRFESKRGSHELFRELAPDHPRIRIAAQRRVASRRELKAVAMPYVLKEEYGVGGAGTRVVATPPAPRRVRGLLLEEYIEPVANPTFDAVIAADGQVHPVGTGAMTIDGTRYQGVTIGPGTLPTEQVQTAAAFGAAVGAALASRGYRGWYDVDFVADRTGVLVPIEINLRLTGPAVAFTIQAALDRLHGAGHVVRTLDCLPLGARLPSAALREHVTRLAAHCQELGTILLVTIPTAAFDPFPYLGIALAAQTIEGLDEAERAIRTANEALGAMFTLPDPERVVSAVGGRRRRRAPLRQS